jgi:glycosyltransferase involved in cell wall biosynthesis
MNSKKILIVSAYFHPDITPRSFRTTELAKELSRNGHDVHVYIPFKGNSYKEFSNLHNIKIYDLGMNFFSEIKINNNNIVFSFFLKILRRLLLMIFEYPDIGLSYNVYNLISKLKGYDLLISIAYPYPIHWGVALAKKKSIDVCKTWVADCGDPYYFDPTEVYKKLFYFKYIEKWFFREVDFITLPNIQMKENYFKEFHDKIVEIPQGFDFENIKVAEYIKNEIITFAFAGTFYPKSRDPRNFINYILSLELDFRFIIYTNSFDLLNEYFILNDKRLVFKEFIPRDNLLLELSQMDFLVNFNYDPINQSPSKLIDYALTRRPIINIQKDFDINLVNEFLKYDFTNQFLVDDINKYNIKYIAKSFIALLDA